MTKLGCGNANRTRPLPKTSFYWIKTTNNSPNRQIDPKAQNWGYFCYFRFWDGNHKRWTNPRQPMAADTIWWRVNLVGCPIFSDSKREMRGMRGFDAKGTKSTTNTMNMMNMVGESRYKHTPTHTLRLLPRARITHPNLVTRQASWK